jgi:cobaltochelatase CobS
MNQAQAQAALAAISMSTLLPAYRAATGDTTSTVGRAQVIQALAVRVAQGQITVADVRSGGAPALIRAQVVDAPAPAFPNPGSPVMQTMAQPAQANPGTVRLAAQVGATELEVAGLKVSMATVAAEIQSLDQRLTNIGHQTAGTNARIGQVGADVANLSARLDAGTHAAQAETKSLRAQVQTLADSLGQIKVDPAEITQAIRVQVEAAFAPIAAAAQANETSSEVLRVAQAGPTGHASALDLFGLDLADVKGAPLMFATYDHPEAPAADPCFIWQESIVRHLHIAQANGRNLWLGGPAGTGKTQTMQQFAAKTGRMFRRFVFDRFTTRDDFLGATGLDNGSTVFQPGPVLEAYTTPGAVCLLDEVGMGQPAALSALNAFLERQAQVAYAGQVWHRAPGTMFPAADNSLGQGDTSGRFAGVQTMNTAFLERFSLLVPFAYLPASLETEALVRHTGCTPALAAHVVDAVGHIRGRVAGGEIIDAPSIRQMVAFVEACRVLDPAEAWRSTIGARQPAESEAGMAAAYAACINESLVRNESQKV